MKKRLLELLCLCLCLSFCLTLLPSCRRAAPLAQNGIRSVELTKKEKIDILVTLNSSTLEKHKNQKVCLYELFPGESLEDLADKDPIAEKKANGSLRFRIPLKENGANRLYSSFAVAFSDGTLIAEEAMGVKNPTFLATIEGRFPWAGTQKGFISDEDIEEGWRMGATHTVISIRLSELLGGSDTLRFNDRQYTYSAAHAAVLDARVQRAANTGIQVSLELILDVTPAQEAVAAMLEMLSARYIQSDEQGFVSAFVITPEGETDPAYAAETARLARLSLLSRVAFGRVYIHLRDKSYSETAEFFSLISRELSQRDISQWGAIVSPDCSLAPWEIGKENELSVDKLPALFQFLNSNQIPLSPSYLAISGLSYSAANEDLQAAMIAYAYRLSVSTGASMVFYDDRGGDAYKLSAEDGTPRRAKRIFEAMDLELSSEDLAMVESLSLGKYTKLPETLSRKDLTGSATVGSNGQKNQILYDFAQNDTQGFSAVSGMASPTCEQSEAMGRHVLYTWLTASAEGGEGVRKLLRDGKELENAFSISLRLLLQNLETPTSKVTLHLDGISKNGAKRISFEASAELSNDSRWQTAIFYIGSFVAEADLSQPCVLTITADTDSPEGTEYLMWLDSVDIRKPEKQLGTTVTLLIALAAVAIGFGLIFLLYKLSAKKKRTAKHRR